jgi:hypothetical protein
MFIAIFGSRRRVRSNGLQQVARSTVVQEEDSLADAPELPPHFDNAFAYPGLGRSNRNFLKLTLRDENGLGLHPRSNAKLELWAVPVIFCVVAFAHDRAGIPDLRLVFP